MCKTGFTKRERNKQKMTEKDHLNEGESSVVQFSLENLTEYQKDSVVSKTIIGKKSGTITLFAFDKGQGLSEHTAPFDAFVYIVDGEASIKVSGKEISVKKGEMVILPANVPHSLYANEQFKMMLVMIKS
jgi:quercetin dioxygenase-like cupin family protein